MENRQEGMPLKNSLLITVGPPVRFILKTMPMQRDCCVIYSGKFWGPITGREAEAMDAGHERVRVLKFVLGIGICTMFYSCRIDI